jgi:hypothetical protein
MLMIEYVCVEHGSSSANQHQAQSLDHLLMLHCAGGESKVAKGTQEDGSAKHSTTARAGSAAAAAAAGGRTAAAEA